MNSCNMGDRDLSYDDDVVKLIRKFKMFLMDNRKKFRNVWGDVKHAKFQVAKLVDKDEKHVLVCPLCYEEGHTRVNYLENDHPLPRYFKCCEVGHMKKEFPNGKLKRQIVPLRKKTRDVEVEFIPRCYKCNLKGHKKDAFPLLNMKKDKVKYLAISKVKVSLDVEMSDGSSDSELMKVAESIPAFNKARKSGIVLKKSKVNVGCSSKNDEYSNVDEINMDDFCLMAGRNKRRKAKSSKVVESTRREKQAIFRETDAEELSSSDDDTCSMARNEMDKSVICLPMHLGEESAKDFSSNITSANDSKLSSGIPQVLSKPPSKNLRELCESIFTSYEDSYEHLVDHLEEMGPKYGNLKKDNKQLALDFANEKCEKLKLATKDQKLEAKTDLLETSLSGLKVSNAAECTIASVSPRCEANNLVNDRVELLEKENFELNNIIKSFTCSKLCLNSLVGRTW